MYCVDKLMLDHDLEDDFFDLLELKKDLDASMWEPSKTCIDKILELVKQVENTSLA